MPLTTYVAGDILTAASLNANFTFAADNPQAAIQVASFSELQASGTGGGTSTSGSFIKRVFNTTILNTITGCTLTSSVIALPAGSYTIVAIAPFMDCEEVQIKLRNTSDSSDTILGTGARLITTNGTSFSVTLNGSFTITATKNFEIQGRVSTGKASDGLGVNLNFTTDNCFAQCTITKVA